MKEDRSNHFSGNIAQKAIIEKDGKVLVCRGVGDTLWEFPGGRLHTDEIPTEGLVREIKEELDLTIEVHRPVHVARSYHGRSKVWRVIIGFECTIIGNTDPHADQEEVEEYKWISTEDLAALSMFDDCREVADAWLTYR